MDTWLVAVAIAGALAATAALVVAVLSRWAGRPTPPARWLALQGAASLANVALVVLVVNS